MKTAVAAAAAILAALALQTTLAGMVIRGTAAIDLVLVVVVYILVDLLLIHRRYCPCSPYRFCIHSLQKIPEAMKTMKRPLSLIINDFLTYHETLLLLRILKLKIKLQ